MPRNIQPTWAWNRPRSAPRQPTPRSAWGLWGSPVRSLKRWCLRWVDTHSITGPSTAADPRTANSARSRPPALNLPVQRPAAGQPDGEAQEGKWHERDDRVGDAIDGLVLDREGVLAIGSGAGSMGHDAPFRECPAPAERSAPVSPDGPTGASDSRWPERSRPWVPCLRLRSHR